jgi:hypothetical protein
MIKPYQIIAGLNEKTGEVIYSRAQHDYITTLDGQGVMDGGQLSGYRIRGLKPIIIELNVDYGTLYDDWNYSRDQYGRTTIDKVKVVPEKEWLDRSSFEFKKQSLTWGTYGKNGDQPRKTICLINAETDHLEAILDTQNHITSETREIIQSILADRDNKNDQN